MAKKQPIKAKTRQEIATELGISYSTFRRKIKEWGIELPTGLLYEHEQTIIYNAFNKGKK
ncbi:MAG: hypothetical protein AAF849_03900 [Bacteroidota bacterium]